MAEIFEFKVGKGHHFSTAFAGRFGATVINDRIGLPEWLGKGFIQEVRITDQLSLCIHAYTLREELILRRLDSGPSPSLTIKFDGRTKHTPPFSLFSDASSHEAELGTGNFFTQLTIPPDQPILLLIVGIERETLIGLLRLGPDGQWIENMIRHNPSFVLQEPMTPEMERTLKQLSQITPSTRLDTLLYHTRAQELIYLLFAGLLSRMDAQSMPVDPADVEKINKVRSAILHDLSLTPRLPKLAAQAGMSLTKMKQLFQQVFGKSIYAYYQSARMEQAAQLLTHLSVSETGYKIGFVNMSHFTRVFERHHQIKPKRYKDMLSTR